MEIKFLDRSTKKICIENPPAQGLMQFLYNNPLGKLGLNMLVKRKIVSAWYGRLMDKPKSTKRIPDFVKSLNIDMSESEKSMDEFSSFNDFFYRKLKPSARPIQDFFVSPGDGKLLAFEKIDQLGDLFVKGSKFSLKAFSNNADLEKRYRYGSMMILRLAPNDYHRFHFPADGTPAAAVPIQGDYYSVSPIALFHDFTKVFCENKRSITELDTDAYGRVLLMPVGATMVGSILHSYTAGKAVRKGDEMGYFAFGGSTIVMLFEPNALRFDRDLVENTRNGMETFVKMGETIGRAIV